MGSKSKGFSKDDCDVLLNPFHESGPPLSLPQKFQFVLENYEKTRSLAPDIDFRGMASGSDKLKAITEQPVTIIDTSNS